MIICALAIKYTISTCVTLPPLLNELKKAKNKYCDSAGRIERYIEHALIPPFRNKNNVTQQFF